MREASLTPTARTWYSRRSPHERAEIDAIIQRLERDPSVDQQHTFYYAVPPLILRAYVDERWNLIYYLPDDASVRVLSIAPTML